MLRCLPFYLFVKLREQGIGNLDKLGNDYGHQIFTASCPGVDNRSADNRTLSVEQLMIMPERARDFNGPANRGRDRPCDSLSG